MWILPSLGRPEKAKMVAEAATDAPIMLRLHWGDKLLEKYTSIKWPKAWNVVIDKRFTLANTLNWAFHKHPKERNYGFIADDTIPSPSDWWQRLEEAAETRYIAYPNDGVHGKNLCTHHCIGGDLIRAVGWWALPKLDHSFLDTTWQFIGNGTGLLRYLEDVRFDHAHPVNGKAEMDDTYRIGQVHFKNDHKIFSRWIESEDSSRILHEINRIFPPLTT